MKTKVVITSMPRISYFQWFVLGFYELQKNNEIRLKLKLPFFSRLLCVFSNRTICKAVNKIKGVFEDDSYLLKGYIVKSNGDKKNFVIDCADSPFLFNSVALEENDHYFKMQCPRVIKKSGFRLNSGILIPWQDHEHVDADIKKTSDIGERKLCSNLFDNKSKIHPLMIGTRRLSNNLTYKSLNGAYSDLIKGRSEKKEKKIVCYFGSSLGPKPNRDYSFVDYDNESSIVSFFGDSLHHPNEKRSKVAEIVGSLGKFYDARVIDYKGSKRDLINTESVPLEEFGTYIGQFEYNFNVSGYRLSIPNRFTDSFAVGTGIITDALSVRWYLPFDENEVVELMPMGYELEEDIDYSVLKKRIKELPVANSKKIIDDFEKKWKPDVVARYIIETVCG